tara:strand:- start:197 stop:1243 length:1047 start_codon:yes stop_codon:yes gene_type:complete
MYKNIINLLLFFIKNFLILVIILFAFESLTRVFFFLILQEKNIFKYGFNKDLEIHTLDLSKFEISIFNRNDLNLVNKIKSDKDFENIDSEIVIWTFGGSTTKGNNCGIDSSSWPNELQNLNKKFIIKNFAQNGYHTDKSVPLLWKNLKNETPNIIIWAHKFNVTKALYGSTRNKKFLNYDAKKVNKNKFFLFINRIDKSFKQSSLFYYFLDQIILRISIKFFLLEPNKKIILDNKSWEIALKNYELNTKEVINLSKQKKVNEFYIVSLFQEEDIPIKKDSHFNYLYDKTIYKLEENTYSKIIDLTKNLNQVKKNIFFCDDMHKTIIGNRYVSEEIYKYLINNSEILNK